MMRKLNMTRRTPLLAGLALALMSGLAASVPEQKGPQRPDYAAFKVISERNIFNANRTRHSAAGDEDKAPRVDTITLVGTMSYEKGHYAFFDGSSAEFSKVLEPGKSIAGYTVAQINHNSVALNAGTNHVELYVGMQLRREEGGDWRVTGHGLAQSRPESSTAPAAGSADDDDIVKKLMQQREQELK